MCFSFLLIRFKDNFINFHQLAQKFKLPNHNLLKYFQIRDLVRNSYTEFPKIPPLESYLLSKVLHSTKGLISAIYTILNNNLLTYKKNDKKVKWESDLECNYDKADWCNILNMSQTILSYQPNMDKYSSIFSVEPRTPLIDYTKYTIMFLPT